MWSTGTVTSLIRSFELVLMRFLVHEEGRSSAGVARLRLPYPVGVRLDHNRGRRKNFASQVSDLNF
uniref:Secreted protein n=1 Tax=Ascaris lumbricoides TaxID=6252 RepID=A0A0M3IUB6_ASCLU